MKTFDMFATLLRTHALAGLGLFALLAPATHAGPFQDEDGSDEAEEDEAEEDDDSTKWLAIVGGDVHTGTGAVLRGATILSRDGRIKAIGQSVTLPEGTEVHDVTGYRVYPGLVAFDSSGLIGRSNSDFGDTVDPFNSRMVLALAAGITTAGQGGTAVKLRRGEIEDIVMREDFLAPLSFSSSNPTGKRDLIEKLEKATAYQRAYREWEIKKKEDKDLKEPSKKGVDSKVLEVLRAETLARFNADDRGELLAIAKLAQRFGFRPVIVGCAEGWTVAGELGRAGAYAVVTPRYRRDKSEELVRPGGSSIENAAILHAAGVQVAIVPASKGVDLGGIVGRDILHLPIEADFAIRGGLSQEAAFEAITIVPARLLGVQHRVGTIEVGKDCDVIVTDGDVMHYQTFVQYAFVAGKRVYDKEAELYFAHIRPRPSSELAPETRVDPGTEDVEEVDEAEETAPAEDDPR